MKPTANATVIAVTRVRSEKRRAKVVPMLSLYPLAYVRDLCGMGTLNAGRRNIARLGGSISSGRPMFVALL